MSKIRAQKVVFFFLPPKLINIILLFYYFNYYLIIFLRSPILDPKIPLMVTSCNVYFESLLEKATMLGKTSGPQSYVWLVT